MKYVYVYGFVGTYNGKPEYDYRYPELNSTHRCIILVSQISDALDFENAVNECNKYGFININGLEGNSLKVESLNTDAGKKFANYYQEALEDGSALAIYPNS